MKRRFVTDDGKQALVTGFMPTIIDSDDLKTMMAALQTRPRGGGDRPTPKSAASA